MKRLLPLLALGLLAGCATYPQYGYYDDARYDRYDDRYSDSDYYGYENDGGDYYYSTQPDRSYYYDDGYYGAGYGYGYGYPSYGYRPYGYAGYGYGGYGYSGYGYRPGLNIGLGYSFGNSYRRGSYPYYYGGRHRNYGHRSGTRDYGNRRDGRGSFRNEGDEPRNRNNDASDVADRLARERGVRDREPRSYRAPDRTRDSASRNGWRSDYRDAQLASPRAAAPGGFSRSASSSPQLRMEPIEDRRSERRYERSESQALPRTPPVQTWRAGDRSPRGDAAAGPSRGRERAMVPQQSYAPAPARSSPSRVAAPPAPSRSSNRGARSPDSGRSRDAEE